MIASKVMHVLEVFYDVGEFQRDGEAEIVAGVPVMACDDECDVRRVEFHFSSEGELEQAKELLKEAGFRFIR